jgi:hypothetical protein
LIPNGDSETRHVHGSTLMGLWFVGILYFSYLDDETMWCGFWTALREKFLITRQVKFLKGFMVNASTELKMVQATIQCRT